jgi:CheY-like chemotaxis protein
VLGGQPISLEPLILLVEDNENDVFAFRRALAFVGFRGAVRVVDSAWQARDYMEGRGAYADRDYYPLPQLVVSDLNLPGASGLELVRWLRDQPAFNALPVALWSGAMSDIDVKRAFQAGITEHYTKTGDFGALVATVKQMTARFAI